MKDANLYAFIENFVDEYEFVGKTPDDREVRSTPSQHERSLIQDALLTVVGNPEFVELLRPSVDAGQISDEAVLAEIKASNDRFAEERRLLAEEKALFEAIDFWGKFSPADVMSLRHLKTLRVLTENPREIGDECMGPMVFVVDGPRRSGKTALARKIPDMEFMWPRGNPCLGQLRSRLLAGERVCLEEFHLPVKRHREEAYRNFFRGLLAITIADRRTYRPEEVPILIINGVDFLHMLRPDDLPDCRVIRLLPLRGEEGGEA